MERELLNFTDTAKNREVFEYEETEVFLRLKGKFAVIDDSQQDDFNHLLHIEVPKVEEISRYNVDGTANVTLPKAGQIAVKFAPPIQRDKTQSSRLAIPATDFVS